MVEQDAELVKCLLADQTRMEGVRALYEPIYRDIDTYIDPFGAGGFVQGASMRSIENLYDTTGIDGLDRGTAAIAGVTIPSNQRWHGLEFPDPELNKLPEVRRWCALATDRLFAARYAPTAGFEVQAHEDVRQELKYGTAPFWIGDDPRKGIFYKSLHLSEIYIEENYYGRVDKVHRKYTRTLTQAVDEFGLLNLSPRLQRDWEDPKKRATEIEFIQVVRPNGLYAGKKIGWQGKPIESIHIEVDQKHLVARGGYYSMPIAVSRHITGPRDVYGRSPAMKVLATIKGANAMARTILDAGNRAVNPPLLFYDDADITKVVTRPGGLNPGGIDEFGRQMIQPLQMGGELPIGIELLAGERAVVKQSFLEEFFRLLSDPSDRMTATQVMETLQKEGVLIRPFAGRRETEKVGPTIERELEIHMRRGTIPPPPDVVREAGEAPRPLMTNPLARMARAEEVSGFTRWAEIGVSAAGAGAEGALDRVNFDAAMPDIAEVLGVRPTHVRSDEEIAEIQEQRQADKQAAQAAQVMPAAAGAALDMAKANELAGLGIPGGL